MVLLIHRSSRLQMFFKISVLKILANFIGKHPCWRPQADKFIKKRPKPRCFPLKFAKFLRTPFFKEHFRWLFLYSWTYKTSMVIDGLTHLSLFKSWWSHLNGFFFNFKKQSPSKYSEAKPLRSGFFLPFQKRSVLQEFSWICWKS